MNRPVLSMNEGSERAARNRRNRTMALPLAILAIALSACGSAGESGSATSDAVTIPFVTAPPTTPQPSTPSTAAVAAVGTTELAPRSTEQVGATVTELATGTTYTALIGDLTFSFEGFSGWGAQVGPNSLNIALPGDPYPLTVQVLRLKDARPSAGIEGADLSGVAVPADPFAARSDLLSAEGIPNAAALRDLPTDPLAYLDSLPGVSVSERGPGAIGGLTGELAEVEVGALPATPQALCATPAVDRCITQYVELGFIYYLTEGDRMQVLETEIGGERFEVTLITTADPEPSAERREQFAAIAGSLRVDA